MHHPQIRKQLHHRVPISGGAIKLGALHEIRPAGTKIAHSFARRLGMRRSEMVPWNSGVLTRDTPASAWARGWNQQVKLIGTPKSQAQRRLAESTRTWLRLTNASRAVENFHVHS